MAKATYMSAGFEAVADTKMLTATPNGVGATRAEVGYLNEVSGLVREQEHRVPHGAGPLCPRA